MDQVQTQQQAMHALAVLVPMILIFWTIGAAIIIIPFWQIFKKAGMAPALSFLMVLPLVNLVMLYVLAFSEWKVIPAIRLPFGRPQYPPQPYAGQAYAPAQPYAPPAYPAAAPPPPQYGATSEAQAPVPPPQNPPEV